MDIGLVTIGQSPREDLLRVFRDRLPDDQELILVGALDDLSPGEIRELLPTNEEESLVTQIRSGASVTIAKERISGLMQQRIDELQARGVGLIVVLCTGSFPELSASVPLVMPDSVLRHFAQGVMPAGSIGVNAPLDAQLESMHEKWETWDTVVMDALNPYTHHENLNELESFEQCGLIVLDCMGYSPAIKRQVREHTGKPVLLAQSLLAHAVELIAGDE